MKHLKTFENNNKNIDIFTEYLTKTYLSNAYGFYEIIVKFENDNYYIDILFVEFDDSSANELTALGKYLSYNWDMNISQLEGDEKFYMISTFMVNVDYFDELMNKIELKNTTDKYNI